MANGLDEKPIHSIVIDTGPLIKNAVSISTILSSAEQLYTTPAIISEIRDAATRSRVETALMPFLNIRTPSPASLEAVVAFSKKTGDFPVLSKQDLGILALAYEVHCERHGGPWGLRNAPGAALNPKPECVKSQDAVREEEEEGQGRKPTEGPSLGERATEASVPATPKEREETPLTASQKQPDRTLETVDQETPEQRKVLESVGNATETPRPLTVDESLSDLQISVSESLSKAEPTPASEDDDSEGDWITPTNLARHQAKENSGAATTQEAQMSVATMTTDFAMQNVLLQMNLNLLSTNMQRIRNVRTQIMRCHACFLTTKQMDKQFCPRCGQPTLNRVNCSTNAKGEFRLHLSKNYQYNKRGDRYSIPKPVSGTASGKHAGKGGGKNGWGRDLVLVEDQKEYVRQIDEGKRSKTKDLMDEDYLPGILSGDRGRAGGRPKVGAGRNVNSRKRF